MTLGTPPARFALSRLPPSGQGAEANPRASRSRCKCGPSELWEKRPQRGVVSCVDLRAHGHQFGLVPINSRCRFGTFANWYTLVVSNARQANQILQEVHSVRMIVAASLRARH
jgi:hypothetical protein